MSALIYINGKLLDLEPGSVIAQTKQINDLNSVDDRQCNFTNKFKVPKTANNVKSLDFLTLTGNRSLVPYQKNECSLYSSNGECFVYKGWAVVTDGGEYYDVVVYDGIIDLYKAIENKVLSDLGSQPGQPLYELNHLKTVTNVIASWVEDKPYRYILADYNGDNGDTANGVINIDYQVPSVNVKWLWGKIFEVYGFAYAGTIFETEDFSNLWMTFPKGQAIAGENDHLIFDADDYSFESPSNAYYYAKFNSAIVDELQGDVGGVHMTIAETATYRIDIKGTLFGHVNEIQKDARIRICKNSIGENPGEAFLSAVFDTNGNYVLGEAADNIPHGDEFQLESASFQLEAGESLCIVITRSENGEGGFILYESDDNVLDVQLYRVDPNVIDFTEAFTDFAIKDFINEITHRFGLTMYSNNVTKVYEFLTLEEQLITAPAVNWSDKLAKKVKEDYIYGNYAQRNWFRYNYNDKEADHNDWYIDVENVNLQGSKDVIKSRIYSPERLKSTFLQNDPSNIYKLWEKEPVEDSNDINYKILDKRYYFIKSSLRTMPLHLESKMLTTEGNVMYYYKENYVGLKWHEVIEKYYRTLSQVLSLSQIVTADLYLKDTDITNFDFRKLYYFEQFASYFYMNKINNYISGKPVRCEMVKVHRGQVLPPPTVAIRITKVEIDDYNVSTFFDLAIDIPTLVFEYSTDQVFWSQLQFDYDQNPFNYSPSSPITWYIRLKAGTEYSNIVSFTLPSNETITP